MKQIVEDSFIKGRTGAYMTERTGEPLQFRVTVTDDGIVEFYAWEGEPEDQFVVRLSDLKEILDRAAVHVSAVNKVDNSS